MKLNKAKLRKFAENAVAVMLVLLLTATLILYCLDKGVW